VTLAAILYNSADLHTAINLLRTWGRMPLSSQWETPPAVSRQIEGMVIQN